MVNGRRRKNNRIRKRRNEGKIRRQGSYLLFIIHGNL